MYINLFIVFVLIVAIVIGFKFEKIYNKIGAMWTSLLCLVVVTTLGFSFFGWQHLVSQKHNKDHDRLEESSSEVILHSSEETQKVRISREESLGAKVDEALRKNRESNEDAKKRFLESVPEVK